MADHHVQDLLEQPLWKTVIALFFLIPKFEQWIVIQPKSHFTVLNQQWWCFYLDERCLHLQGLLIIPHQVMGACIDLAFVSALVLPSGESLHKLKKVKIFLLIVFLQLIGWNKVLIELLVVCQFYLLRVLWYKFNVSHIMWILTLQWVGFTNIEEQYQQNYMFNS